MPLTPYEESMPDKGKNAKAIKWLGKKSWLELFGEYIVNCPDRAERLMIMMMSIRYLMLGRRAERNKALHAINNCIKACIPYTRTKVITELMKEEKRRREQEGGPC